MMSGTMLICSVLGLWHYCCWHFFCLLKPLMWVCAFCYYNMTGEGTYSSDLFQDFLSDWKLISNFIMEWRLIYTEWTVLGRYIFFNQVIATKEVVFHGLFGIYFDKMIFVSKEYFNKKQRDHWSVKWNS